MAIFCHFWGRFYMGSQDLHRDLPKIPPKIAKNEFCRKNFSTHFTSTYQGSKLPDAKITFFYFRSEGLLNMVYFTSGPKNQNRHFGHFGHFGQFQKWPNPVSKGQFLRAQNGATGKIDLRWGPRQNGQNWPQNLRPRWKMAIFGVFWQIWPI